MSELSRPNTGKNDRETKKWHYCCALRIMGREKSKFELTKFVDFALRTTEIFSIWPSLCCSRSSTHGTAALFWYIRNDISLLFIATSNPSHHVINSEIKIVFFSFYFCHKYTQIIFKSFLSGLNRGFVFRVDTRVFIFNLFIFYLLSLSSSSLSSCFPIAMRLAGVAVERSTRVRVLFRCCCCCYLIV